MKIEVKSMNVNKIEKMAEKIDKLTVKKQIDESW